MQTIKIPSFTWQAEVETRLAGAIGIFTWETIQTRAFNEEQAQEWMLADLHYEGKETRGFRNFQRLDIHN